MAKDRASIIHQSQIDALLDVRFHKRPALVAVGGLKAYNVSSHETGNFMGEEKQPGKQIRFLNGTCRVPERFASTFWDSRPVDLRVELPATP